VTDLERQRAALRRHWEEKIAFNALCGFRVTRWDPDGVTMEVDFAERLSNSLGSLHGGVIATLIDTAANGAVAAQDDYEPRSPMNTVSMSLQYLAAARERLVVEASCTKRGQQLTYVQVAAHNGSGTPVAQALVTVSQRRDRE
jgi:uncharacterized protein (TIGR00369 family)